MSNLEINKGDQFIVAADISGSMNTADCKGGLTRLAYMMETLGVFIGEAQKYDPDGVSIYLFGATVHQHRDQTAEAIPALLANLKTESATQTHLAINAAYAEHVEKGSQQTFLLVFTDGSPSDPEAVKQSIIDITNKVKDPLEFRIAFITVGEPDANLRQYLTDLDDNLKGAGAAHDIVDVKGIDEVDFMAAINGALTD